MAKSETKTASTHPVETMNREVERRGLIVVDQVNRLPVYDEPYISQNLILVLNHEGSSNGEYDMRPIHFRRHDFSVIYPNHTILANDSTDDYCVTLIIISNNFYKQLRNRLTYGNNLVFHSQPLFHLTDEQYQCVCDAVVFLKTVSQMNLERSMEVMASIIDTLSLMADEFRHAMPNAASTSTGNEGAVEQGRFNRFYECLVNHYRESRKVGYYASQLCLSPKYFGSIIMRETGVSASEWIARYVIIRAKTLLRHYPDLTIQQVANELGFDDQSVFCRYFKRNTGMSPKDYREQKIG